LNNVSFRSTSLRLKACGHESSSRRSAGKTVFSPVEQGIDWPTITAAILLVAFPVFQRQFVQSFMRAGIR
jgi:hypothetical protein